MSGMLGSFDFEVIWRTLPYLFLDGMRFTLMLTMLATIGGVVLGTLLAIALVRYRFRARSAISLLLFLPMATPEVVLGAAIALNLLLGLPLIWGVTLTALDVLIILFLQQRGFRYVEALVVGLILLIAGSFAVELWLAQPVLGDVAAGFIPSLGILGNTEMLYIAIGILGATVMPHNLYLHSSIVQTRKYADTNEGKREAIRFATIDSSFALMFALFINAAILIMAAAMFHGTEYENVADIGDAHKLLSPLLGTSMASTLFAVALLCSGQNATLTGTLAGQIVMEGFINLRLRPWLRRLITRLIAIIPAVIVIAIYGDEGTGPLLILSVLYFKRGLAGLLPAGGKDG